MQQFLGSILSGFEVEEFLVLVDELRVHGGVEELVVGQNVLQEWDVGLEMQREIERRKLYWLSKHFRQSCTECKNLRHNIERNESRQQLKANSANLSLERKSETSVLNRHFKICAHSLPTHNKTKSKSNNKVN